MRCGLLVFDANPRCSGVTHPAHDARTPAHFRISRLDYPEIDISLAVNTDGPRLDRTGSLLTPSEAFHLLRKQSSMPWSTTHKAGAAGPLWPGDRTGRFTNGPGNTTSDPAIHDQLDRLRLAFLAIIKGGASY